jgi:AraC-like DNA-binding protein
VDALADVVDASRISGTLLAHVRARAPWGLDLDPAGGAAFHAVTAGSVWLHIDGSPAMQLMPGDVALLPRGNRHRLLSAPDVPARRYDAAMKAELSTPEGDLVIAGPGPASRFLCAGYDYDHELGHPLLSLLPPVLVVSAADDERDTPVQTTLRLLMLELGRREAGSRAVAERLIEVLFVHVMRAWIDANEAGGSASWLRGLRDPTVARALALLHNSPEYPWTLEDLARAVHVSRSTLIRRFSELVGEPPLGYLTRWRMHLAAQRLKHTSDSVGTIARDVGYSSEYAFNRAFSRHRGQPPGRYRRLARIT